MFTSITAPRSRRHPGRSLRAFAAILWLGAGAIGAGADGRIKFFSLPAGDATKALITFAEQSGQQVIYLRDEVRGIRTNQVNGRFTARDAIGRMFAGTLLRVVEDGETGALMIRREPAAPKPHPPPEKQTLSRDTPRNSPASLP